MKTEHIIIENLHCDGCAASIRNSLSKLPGVKGVSVNLLTNTVSVEHAGEANREALVRKLDQMGYAEAGNSTVLKRAKSYVSCAIGRMT